MKTLTRARRNFRFGLLKSCLTFGYVKVWLSLVNKLQIKSPIFLFSYYWYVVSISKFCCLFIKGNYTLKIVTLKRLFWNMQKQKTIPLKVCQARFFNKGPRQARRCEDEKTARLYTHTYTHTHTYTFTHINVIR